MTTLNELVARVGSPTQEQVCQVVTGQITNLQRELTTLLSAVTERPGDYTLRELSLLRNDLQRTLHAVAAWSDRETEG